MTPVTQSNYITATDLWWICQLKRAKLNMVHFGVYVYWYIQIHMAWLLTCLISLYTYRIQPPLQRLHTGHLHSNHVTATSLIVLDSFSSCTVEFDVEIRNHFWIWSKYTWKNAPPVATLFLHFSPGFILQWRSATRSCSTTWGPWKKPATWQLLAPDLAPSHGATVGRSLHTSYNCG